MTITKAELLKTTLPFPAMAKIKDLGEFGLINRLSKNFKHRLQNSILTIGDDCAVFSGSSSKNQLVSTDALVENIHFKLSTITAEQLGEKALSVNISDIAAMGGTPTRALITLGISKKVSVLFLDQLYKGIHKICKRYQIELSGGDTVASPNCFFINITIIGETNPGRLFTRKGAKPGDLIYTTGVLGDSSLGLKLLNSPGRSWKCSTKIKKHLIQKHLAPIPRLKESQALAKSKIKITSMIDLSDGLVQDLYHICQQSGTGALIYEEMLPISPSFLNVCSNNKLNPLPLVLGGGEDYELLFTLPPDDVKNLNRQFKKAKALVTPIGEITRPPGKVFLKRKNGEKENLPNQSGFNHF